MTTFTVPIRLSEDPVLRPVPWRRMIWVTWRQHRVALGATFAFLGAASVTLLSLGVRLHHAYAAAIGCRPEASAACGALVHQFNGMDNFLRNGIVFQVVPPLIGAFVGATVLARELESGSFRFSWTQGFVRWRWALAKLVGLGVAVAAVTGLFGVLTTWYYQPYFAAGNQALTLSALTPLEPGLFDVRGVAPAAWTLAAFAIGGLAGMLVRRVVPAMVATLVGYSGLAFAAATVLREHYLSPVVTSKRTVPGSAWVLSHWGTRGGKLAFTGGPPLGLLQRFCPAGPTAAVGKSKFTILASCLTPHGYSLWTGYQPASRFWSFQWIEASWLLALSAVLVVTTVWLVRRRAV